MLVNSFEMQNPYQRQSTGQKQISFGQQKPPSISELQEVVRDLTEQLAKYPYNRTLKAKLKLAKEFLEKASAGK
ncbi:MAG: hypothetical protein PHC34_04340 [Candidatus Gastranaerophilales bacterium]|nr:hypothetical protein [Candidatus Gastranaerophilales bacterium]